MFVTFIALFNSLFSSIKIVYSQSDPATCGFTLFFVLASSMLTATSSTPNSFCHILYTSFIALSSLIHGPHQVAQKLTITGFSDALYLEMFTLFPLMSVNITLGNFD